MYIATLNELQLSFLVTKLGNSYASPIYLWIKRAEFHYPMSQFTFIAHFKGLTHDTFLFLRHLRKQGYALR